MRILFVIAAFVLSACGGLNTLGAACTTDTECTKGQTCQTDLPQGFCGAGCSTQGSAVGCPAGSVCAYQGGTRLLCSPICTQDSECRENYRCAGVIGGTLAACTPKAT